MSTDPEVLRQAMRYWTTGVTVVTSTFKGTQHGMTVSSFTSVSLNPPQVLISLAENTRTYELVLHSRIFGVTILSEDQQAVSDRFAGRIPDEQDRLSGLETFTLTTGAPLIMGGLAYFDCRVVTTLGSGSHTIFIGEVLQASNGPSGNPLLYYNRNYGKLLTKG